MIGLMCRRWWAVAGFSGSQKLWKPQFLGASTLLTTFAFIKTTTENSG
jgi:hypothetical protein